MGICIARTDHPSRCLAMKKMPQLPEDIQKQLVDDLARIDRDQVGSDEAATSIQSEIHSLTKTQAELTQRIASLSARVVDDETAAQELSNVERRAAAIRTRLEQV